MEKSTESEAVKPEVEGKEDEATADEVGGEVPVEGGGVGDKVTETVVDLEPGDDDDVGVPDTERENLEEGDTDTPASPPGEDVIREEEEVSIMEMEVEDSNTGDTITSNPEIDLGSAAAAATAVIIEEQETDKIEEEEPEILIVSTCSQRVEPVESAESSVVAPSASSSSSEGKPPIEEMAEEDAQMQIDEEMDTEVREIASPGGTVPAVIDEPSTSSVVELVEPASPDSEQGESYSEAMDISEDVAIIENPEIAEPTPEVLESGDFSAPEVEQDLIEPTEPESDSVFEAEPDEFLQEEDSMTSLPDDATETDKENNVVGDPVLAALVGDDDNDDDETYLEITRRRISQDREGNCYCGKDRNFNISELLCASCIRWHHESCISYQLGKLVPFTTNYVFTCKNCSPTGLECFRRNQAQFSQMCVTALANLTQASVKDGTNIKLFSKDRDIIPFFEMHWEALTTTTRRLTQSWHSTVSKTLIKDAGVVYSCQEVPGDEFSPYFGLVSDDLTLIRPNYEAMIKSGQLKITDSRNSSSALRGRGAKRRTVDSANSAPNTVAKKPRGDTFGQKPLIGHGYPIDHPYNKDGYRYHLAEPDPNAPFRQEFDESNEWSGKPIHGWLCRVVNPPSVILAVHDRATQLRVSEDRLSVTGEKGYCMIRATHGVTRGSWYFEAKITDMPEGSASRIGFGQQFGNLQGPLGFDRYGYSWRSRYGTTFHEAKGKSYAKGGYGLDDVLGFLIVMPEADYLPSARSFKDRPLVKVKSHLYYEEKDEPSEMNKKDLRSGSKIICFKNGVCQGVAFEDIYCGTYYPTISLYKSITVRMNFGPDFEAPPTDHEYRGMSERAEEQTIEQTMADLLYLTENEGELRLDNAVPMPI